VPSSVRRTGEHSRAGPGGGRPAAHDRRQPRACRGRAARSPSPGRRARRDRDDGAEYAGLARPDDAAAGRRRRQHRVRVGRRIGPGPDRPYRVRRRGRDARRRGSGGMTHPQSAIRNPRSAMSLRLYVEAMDAVLVEVSADGRVRLENEEWSRPTLQERRAILFAAKTAVEELTELVEVLQDGPAE